MLSIIVAFGDHYEIGQNGTMPWNLPEDLKHFKEVTSGATILMGRRTFQSLPGVLPKRQHIIITADPEFQKEHKRVRIRHDLEAELRNLCEDYSNYRNFCVPCKMLVAKIKRKEGKGFTCEYDKPQTPYARVLADNAVPQDVKDALIRRKAKINGIELYHRILKRLRRIRRR